MAISDELRKLVDPNNECCCEHCLSNKCKEWAEYNGWFLYPCRNFESTFKKFGCSIMKPYYKAGKFSWLLSTDGYDERDYLADTEIQAVFNACQWILDNKGSK